jgi:hypothetical protein
MLISDPTAKRTMKTRLHSMFIGLAILAGVRSTLAQNPVISSFSQNGMLVCTNLQPGTEATVQRAIKVKPVLCAWPKPHLFQLAQ